MTYHETSIRSLPCIILDPNTCIRGISKIIYAFFSKHFSMGVRVPNQEPKTSKKSIFDYF